ncbi:MAG: hypothetical protein ACOYOS_00370 [Syntrophales bacterium]
MFGIKDLKPKITLTQATVECPVKGCCRKVERQRRSFQREKQFLCPDHEIYISPSTFEYENEKDNLLWHHKADLDLLDDVKKIKRESRIARDNSEDALTWNIFRYLENSHQLTDLLSHIVQEHCRYEELIYWSYSSQVRGAWPELDRARETFGENPARGSEPDLIVVTDKALFFIEAKLTATNNTMPSRQNAYQYYLTGSNEWHKRVFRSDFVTIAVQAKKYELFRFWLIGTWLAKKMKRDFYLINLVLSEREQDIEEQFLPYLIIGKQRQFKRLSWESIYGYIVGNAPDSLEKEMLVTYFQNKTIGYKSGTLQEAFSIS